MFRSAFPHARSPKAGHAHARSGKAFDYMAISGLLSNRIRDHPALAGQIRMPYVPGFHQNTPLLSLRPVLHRLRDMPGAQLFRAFQVGDRARHPQRPVQHAGRAAQAAHGLQQQLPPALVQRAMAVQFRAGQGRVGLVLTFQLPPTAGQDPLTHRRRGLPGGPSSSSGPPAAGADAGRCGPARARDAARVARHLVRRAGAGPHRVPAPAAGARVHGRDQLEAGRKARRAHGPRDQHPAGFQRLAQRFQRAPVEFGQFIQKQHAVMRQADLSRPGMGAAAHQRRHGQE